MATVYRGGKTKDRLSSDCGDQFTPLLLVVKADDLTLSGTGSERSVLWTESLESNACQG